MAIRPALIPTKPGDRRLLLATSLVLLAACAFWPRPGRAYPGLYIPEEAQAGFRELGFDVSEALIEQAQRATVRVAAQTGVGSGAIVSPSGLVWTAAHMLRNPRWANGTRFAAGSREQEKTLADIVVQVPLASFDVTDRIEPAIRALVRGGMPRLAAEERACAELETSMGTQRQGLWAGVGPDPRFPTRYTVRLATEHRPKLVLLPEPHEGDMALLRVDLGRRQDDVNHLPMMERPLEDEELVLGTGFAGATSRIAAPPVLADRLDRLHATTRTQLDQWLRLLDAAGGLWRRREHIVAEQQFSERHERYERELHDRLKTRLAHSDPPAEALERALALDRRQTDLILQHAATVRATLLSPAIAAGHWALKFTQHSVSTPEHETACHDAVSELRAEPTRSRLALDHLARAGAVDLSQEARRLLPGTTSEYAWAGQALKIALSRGDVLGVRDNPLVRTARPLHRAANEQYAQLENPPVEMTLLDRSLKHWMAPALSYPDVSSPDSVRMSLGPARSRPDPLLARATPDSSEPARPVWADVMHGMSGGPLFNDAGMFVGLITGAPPSAKFVPAESLWAVESHVAFEQLKRAGCKHVLDELAARGPRATRNPLIRRRPARR